MLAIVIIGQMRSYKNIKIINSYKKYLSNNETIDLYIFTLCLKRPKTIKAYS